MESTFVTSSHMYSWVLKFLNSDVIFLYTNTVDFRSNNQDVIEGF